MARYFSWFALGPAVLLMGCSPIVPPSEGTFSTPAASTIVSDGRNSTPSPTPVPGAVRSCLEGDVGIAAVWWQGATATLAGGFAIYSTGSEPCSVAGTVSVEIRDARDHLLPIRVNQLQPGASIPVVLLPNLGTPSPEDGPVTGRAEVLMYWTNWCGPAFDGNGTLTASIRDVGAVKAPFGSPSPPRCDSPDSPSVIAVGPIVRQDPNA